MQPREVITRRNLPHWYVPGAAHFVTYRLAGTIPAHVIGRFHDDLKLRLAGKPLPGFTPSQHRERAHKHFFADYDRYLDRNTSIDWLKNPAVAAIVRQNLLHHNGAKYHLLAYCVMPNHVHVLFQPVEGVVPSEFPDSGEFDDSRSGLSTIMHSLKSFTAKEANKVLMRTGQFWQHESYDHWVRNDDELERIVEYIAYNPVRRDS